MVVTRSKPTSEGDGRLSPFELTAPSTSRATSAMIGRPQTGGRNDTTTAAPASPGILHGGRSRAGTSGEAGIASMLPTSPTRSVQSVRSTKSTRIRQKQLEAEEKLAAIKKKELQMEAELIKKKLAWEIASMQEEDCEASVTGEKRNERIEEWINENSIIPETPRLPQDVERPRPTETRPRSPTPARERGRGIERLADAIEKMAKNRPPPRQVVELPLFSGAPGEWLPFKTAMRESTNIYSFTSAENMARLRNCLRGEAKEAVTSLLHLATDPAMVMKTLEQCFGRPEVLVNNALDNLKKIARPGQTAAELNTFAVKVQNIVCVLNNVDVKGYIYNPQLTREVLEKLSPHLRSRWCDFAEENITGREPELTLMSRFLMREADRALKYTHAAGQTASAAINRREVYKPTAYQPPRRKEMAVYTVEQEERRRCEYCNEEHDTEKCRKLVKLNVDQRWEWAKKERVCFKCLKRKHSRYSCKAKVCGVEECNKPHHALLHTGVSETATRVESVLSVATNEKKQVLLKVCPVRITGKKGTVNTYALLDEGSTVTLIDHDLAKQVGAEGPVKPLCLRGVYGTNDQLQSKRVQITIQGLREENKYEITARTMSGLNLRQQTLPKNLQKYKHLKGIPTISGTLRPRILIGTDQWQLAVTRRLRSGNPREPAASYTNLGWVIHGTSPQRTLKIEEDSVLHIMTTERTETERIDDILTWHFDIDALGITTAVKRKPCDERAERIFAETVKKTGNGYEVGLPWKRDEVVMPPSYEAALKRLKNTEAKLERDNSMASEYNKQIDNLLKKGYAEKCAPRDRDSEIAWYLPHFAVRNPNKPGKLRLVFDAAARANGVSLNDHLLEGPDLLNSLLGILLRFRERPVAVVADIEEMFLRVKIREKDQPAQMFLWRTSRDEEPTRYKMTSMFFGASSSPFLAHSVRNKNAESIKNTHPRAYECITRNHYMDDLVDSFDTEEEASNAIETVDLTHKKANFVLRGWLSNSSAIMKKTVEGARANITPLGEKRENKTLGLLWNADEDVLQFNTSLTRVNEEVKTGQRAPTKREALSAVMSVYDPLGLLSPFTIAAKIQIQRLWKASLGWDENLPDEETQLFHRWLGGLQTLKKLKIPRYCFKGHGERELHVYCDASETAYAAVAYWRTERENDNAFVMLAAAKAKVAPLKTQTVPRLELQAALIGTRLAATILKEQKTQPSSVVYWTDSTTVLHWIRNDAKRYTPYVAHRLGEIAESTHPEQWKWVPTELNPADDGTRQAGIDGVSEKWLYGPAYLQLARHEWPSERDSDAGEERDCAYHVATTEIRRPPHWDAMPEIDRFSNYDRLINATARIIFIAEKWRKSATKLEVRHIEQAENLWLERSQTETFYDDLKQINKGETVKKHSRLFRLDPVYEDGLLRLRGRTDAIRIDEGTRRPIILDGRHPLTRLLVMKYHQRAGHANNERVVNDIRQVYWILHLRPTVRTARRICQWCRVNRATPSIPPTGDLPLERLDVGARPFTNCGVDYFGPLFITNGRRREKRWCALFTCLTTRAVHLEIVRDLSSDAAIMALRRMAARRGWPRVVMSDNATNFHGADSELRAAFRGWQPHLEEYALAHRLQWKFIPPGAPNQGGAWERLVRSVKTALSTTLKEKYPKEEVLHTLMLEAEQAINARPLTHVSVDPNDPEALTPNHFLIGSSSGLPYMGRCQGADRRSWRVSQALAGEFWRRWVREYLPTLAPRGDSNDGREELQPGKIVVVVDHNLPRNTWPLGRIERIYPGPDGRIRSIDVRTNAGVFKRPTRKIAVLPVEATTSLRRGEDVEDGNEPVRQTEEITRISVPL